MSGSIFPLNPAKISWTSKVKPKWDVTKYTSASQGRKTLTHQEYPTWQFDISFPMLSSQEVDALQAFFMTCKGSWNPFFYKDAERYAANVTLKPAGTYYYKANGLPLTIPIKVGDYVFGEPCYMADNVRVYRDGVEDTENFTVSADDSGQLQVYLTDVETTEGTLQSTVITATYEYYYKVAFQDSITINQKFKDFYSVSLSLETVRQLITDTGDNDKWQGYGIYNITIIQGSHQTIAVKKYVNGVLKGNYTGNFQIIGKCVLEVTVTPESGYLAGDLYINNRKYNSGVRLTPTEDLVIFADIAVTGAVVYMNGSRSRFTSTVDAYYLFYSEPECTHMIDKGGWIGRYRCYDVSDGLPADGAGLFGGNSPFMQRAQQVNYIEANIDVSRKTDLHQTVGWCSELIGISGLESWDVQNAVSISEMFRGSGHLRSVGDISHWQTPNLTTMYGMFRDTAMISIDFHDWYTPNLVNVGDLFSGCSVLRVVDISGIDTTYVTNASGMFSGCSALQYVIMDSDDVKFSGNVSCPNANSNVKYLVRASKLEAYRTHANWSARAERILNIADFNIVRENGNITVTPRA